MIVLAVPCLPSGCRQAPKTVPDAQLNALVSYVDSVVILISPSLLGEDFEGAIQSTPAMKFSASKIEFPERLDASLVGTREKPLAIVFYSRSDIATYYVPFNGVLEIDRPRRLSKLAERVYRLECNRSGKGVLVERKLP